MDPITALVAALQAVPVAGPILPYIPLVCGVCALFDAAVPASVGAGSSWRAVVHFLALNIAHARNAGASATTPPTGPIATLLGLALLSTLGACSAQQVQTAVNDAQLFCAVGQTTAALAQVSGSTVSPVIAKGMSSTMVQTMCSIAGGVAVSPPANPSAAPTITIPAITVPVGK